MQNKLVFLDAEWESWSFWMQSKRADVCGSCRVNEMTFLDAECDSWCFWMQNVTANVFGCRVWQLMFLDAVLGIGFSFFVFLFVSFVQSVLVLFVHPVYFSKWCEHVLCSEFLYILYKSTLHHTSIACFTLSFNKWAHSWLRRDETIQSGLPLVWGSKCVLGWGWAGAESMGGGAGRGGGG